MRHTLLFMRAFAAAAGVLILTAAAAPAASAGSRSEPATVRPLGSTLTLAYSLHLVPLSGSQTSIVEAHDGTKAIWVFNSALNRFQSLLNFRGEPPGQKFASEHVAETLLSGRPPSSLPPSKPSPTKQVVVSSTPSRIAAPADYSASQLEFNGLLDKKTSFAAEGWNTFITSAGADGAPWNSNGHGGSNGSNPFVDYVVDYDLPSQVSQHGGEIFIRAVRRETAGMIGSSAATYPFASGVLSSYGKFDFTGGYVQIEAKMPAGSGMWPGLWMLPGPGTSGGDNYEIDLFEGGYDDAGGSPATTFAWHLHTPSGTVGSDTDTGVNLTNAFHTYGLQWIPGRSITWYLDGRVIGSVTSAQASIPDEPMELIMNLQVANTNTGSWHTLPNASTPEVNTMTIAGVQVYSLGRSS